MNQTERFYVSRSFDGIVCIKDRERQNNGVPRVAALFFKDSQQPQAAEILAGLAVKVFNAEAARRAGKVEERAEK